MFRKTKTRLLGCLKSRDGIAATEFALILPVLVVLFFGMLETSDVMTMNRRVALAVNTMADLTAQTEQLTTDDIDDLIEGVFSIIEPNDTSVLNVSIVSVVLEDGSPVVHWSQDETGDAPYDAGDAYEKLNDDDVVTDTGSVIVVEISYPYTPRFTQYFVTDPFTFKRMAIRWPRLTRKVQLCDGGGNCTT